MKWPWSHTTEHDERLVRDVTDARGQVQRQAERVRVVAARLDRVAASALIARNVETLRSPWTDRRRRADPAYAGPERRHR